MGMYDGVDAYDLNGDGKAEVILKIANGVTFPNGTVFKDADDTHQYIAILDGMTGNPIAFWEDVFWALLNSNEFILNH